MRRCFGYAHIARNDGVVNLLAEIGAHVARDGIAETEVDQTFSNPGSQPIEGWYWFNVPETATVTGLPSL